jgi:hypothetical protein
VIGNALRLPFEHLNLRRNPFGELTLEERGRLAVADLKPLAERLAAPPFVLQVIGECGRGKTSLLVGLRARFPGAPYIYLPEDGPLPRLPKAQVLFVDETQRLSRWTRRRLFRRGIALAIGTHLDHSPELRRAGVPFQTVRVGGADPEHVARIVTGRIEAMRRAPGPVPTLAPAQIAALVDRFGDDLRAIEHYLYRVFQRLEGIGHVEV